MMGLGPLSPSSLALTSSSSWQDGNTALIVFLCSLVLAQGSLWFMSGLSHVERMSWSFSALNPNNPHPCSLGLQLVLPACPAEEVMALLAVLHPRRAASAYLGSKCAGASDGDAPSASRSRRHGQKVKPLGSNPRCVWGGPCRRQCRIPLLRICPQAPWVDRASLFLA